MKRKRISDEIKKGIKYLNTGLIIILILAGTMFVVNVSTSSQLGYEFRQQTLRNKELTTENNRLKLEVLQSGSYKSLQDKYGIKNMQPASDAEYFESRKERLSRAE